MIREIGVGLAFVLLGLALMAGFAPLARAGEWEIWAKRAGQALREDAPNIIRIRQDGEEPFASREDCQQVIRSTRIDARLGKGWSLVCWPVEVPVARMVVR